MQRPSIKTGLALFVVTRTLRDGKIVAIGVRRGEIRLGDPSRLRLAAPSLAGFVRWLFGP